MFKFRAYDKEEQKMRDVLSLHTMTGMAELDNRKYKLYPDEVVIMQATAFSDKKSNIIFDGDIVKTEEGIFVIKYHEAGFVYAVSKTSSTLIGTDSLDELEREIERIKPFFEVIGNIYENEDLLK